MRDKQISRKRLYTSFGKERFLCHLCVRHSIHRLLGEGKHKIIIQNLISRHSIENAIATFKFTSRQRERSIIRIQKCL